MLLENAPCVECMDKGLCFLLKHRNIIATAYWIYLLNPSFVISQGQPCWHTFHALISAKNKRQIKYVKPKLPPLYFHSSHAWYAWLLYYKIQQFFIECIKMHECYTNFAFLSHSSIYTAFLNIHCFFFPLVYIFDILFYHLTCLCNYFYGLSALVGCWSLAFIRRILIHYFCIAHFHWLWRRKFAALKSLRLCHESRDDVTSLATRRSNITKTFWKCV